MKRSRAISLVLVSAVSSGMIACREKPARYCVDGKNQVVENWDCEDRNDHAHVGYYHWYYGGWHGPVPIGTTLSGGSPVKPAGGFSTPAETARGIFGGAGEGASAHGGGEGGGE